MKTVSILALAAGVSATFNLAPPFTCPGNTDNKCTDKQKPGFSWDDLDFGDFLDYRDFNFRGWKCEDDGDKRGRFAPRTGKRVIGGTCSSEKQKSPSFGCGAAIDKFSLGSIHVKPEFDCDLEFHYDMPDGSTCKHRSACRKSGTTVVNRQCGGAKNVTIVFPPQPDKPKPSCSIQVPTISFDCSTASSTSPPRTKTTKTPGSPTPPVKTTTTSEVKESSSTPPAEASSTPPAETSTPVVPGVSSTPGAETSTAIVPGVSSTPGAETSTSTVAPGQETSTSPAQESSTPPAEQSSDSSSSVPPVTKTITTSYDSTSTIFTTTTTTHTITSCGPTVPDCPANSVVTSVITVAVSTTICPVTETLTRIESSAPPSSATGAATTATPAASGTTSLVSSVSSVSSVAPVETLPCPAVVPSCLNTFLFTIGCSDNTDAACYCPDATFIKNVYDCLYAHGETDAIVAEAVAYFQGICGKWVNENPAIATGATVTTYITVTAQPTVAPVYTTVIVDVTTVVPCTDDAGEVIPSSSTTVTVSTSMTVPQVDFTTGSSGGVEIIPITAAPAVTTSPGSPSAGGPGGAVVTTNGTTLSVPTGTGSIRPSTTSSIVVAGGGRVGASFGLAAAVAFVAAVAL
ncbi:hypothetical protein C8A01DRAFT_33767 [Parachaetomium inaequale]|uniref:CFEM domain-containing protein n=1 Tax=Parachaetomium inaequale TaxID=2588326 RepID=A0AAN6PK20_9PEZI|nr:hypothetical protein C8A01DRAFT_33767 [Parachaetomium inaequale]